MGKTIKVKVAFTNDRGNTESLTSEATVAVAAKPVPLTVSVSNAPASHGGNGTNFTFDPNFSENVRLSYVTIRDQVFREDGGEVVNAKRKVEGSNTSWTVTVKATGNGPVTR